MKQAEFLECKTDEMFILRKICPKCRINLISQSFVDIGFYISHKWICPRCKFTINDNCKGE